MPTVHEATALVLRWVAAASRRAFKVLFFIAAYSFGGVLLGQLSASYCISFAWAAVACESIGWVCGMMHSQFVEAFGLKSSQLAKDSPLGILAVLGMALCFYQISSVLTLLDQGIVLRGWGLVSALSAVAIGLVVLTLLAIFTTSREQSFRGRLLEWA
eukprot:Sspe_Gene.101889::Locus_76564_Transcript_2_2_Confidence_0.667_Length_560::g.101889::m.101889